MYVCPCVYMESPCLTLPQQRWGHRHMLPGPDFTWALAIQTQVLTLMEQAFQSLNHLFSPKTANILKHGNCGYF